MYICSYIYILYMYICICKPETLNPKPFIYFYILYVYICIYRYFSLTLHKRERCRMTASWKASPSLRTSLTTSTTRSRYEALGYTCMRP